ncbi:hypothetical protein WG66_001503 [Moniliophthora roreri]|uniref:Mismatched base pair and cruciform DNA recognition protein n=1 Tax=Moniliophthora roreri TaxID=221103 RepID=A0A0W0G5M5_MONRR|nr:hypothetical protein WG66_001503 [Moniliophthora roreri]
MSTNNMTSDEPNKRSGQLHSTKGNIKETVGGMVGAHGMQQRGQEEHARGQAEYDAARGKGYAEGIADRITGKKDAIVGAATGDKTQQAKGNMRQEQGSAQQEVNRRA